ncbi:MAG: tandem-95 repeat protein [Sphingomonas sp.]|uniref:Ig-like domain-containing protein n=1 Tax=Sphingomonas sp. TaxID=28214 RepID=UPI0025DE7525|nr:Ig-like domain-containing protein [Sphingomonas sp.]MBQ1497337.1 tandem-95 repeat protein [Sphingomonas sp.]
MKQLFTPMAAHVGNMVRNRARGHLVPGSSARSLLATLKERLPDLASLSAGVRRGARTGALALAALAASVPGTGWASAGCDYLDANVLSSVTGTTLTGDFNTDPNPSLSAPNPFTAGAANFVSGDTVLYAYANLSNARATVRRAPSTGGFVTLVNGATIAGNGSYAVAADHTRFFVVTQVSSTGAGSVDFRMYCEIATTQAVASITATVGSGVSVTPVTAAYGSGARSYAVSPALPTGLSFNTSTGAITGTPTATSATTTYTVTASYTGGLGTSSKTFALTVNPPPPTVTAVSPNAGPTGGSTTVTITGTGFSIANNTGAVMFGPNPATYTIDSNTQITATAPAGSAGFVDVTVTTPGGTSTTSAADRYTYVAAPTVTAVSPIAGPIGGGTAVTITGTGFSAAAPTGAVKFGAALATYTIISNTQINATSPANAASTYDVTVTTPGGTSAISAADQFTYVAAPTVTSISPTAGPTSGGTTVTITGTGFSAANPTGAVKFGATLATYTINNNTQITATSPASLAGTYDVTVATPGGTSATSAADQYTYIAAPVASSFTASAVAYNGTGLTFSIAGHATNSPTNFAVGSATTAQGGSVSVNAAGLVTYDAPSGFRGNDSFTFTATNLGGTSAPATVTVPVSNPTLVSTLAGSGTRGIALSGVQINTSGGRATYSCSTTLASGALPLGTQLNGDCTVTGTPAASGNFTFTANVTDSSLGTGPFTQPTGSLTLSIAAPTVTLSPAAGALPGATVGTSYSQSFTGGGGTTGYTFARTSGALPTGLTLSAAGVITGTPTATGTSNFDVTVTDGSSAGSGGPYTATQSYSITVASGSQTISFAALPNASLSASPLTLSATATSGLTVSFASTTASVCTVSGTTLTLLQTGNCAITASQAGDANWAAATDVSRSFTVTPANLVLATGSASGLIVGGSYSQANTASGGLTPYTYSLNAGAFVPGTTLGSDGTVSGSPTVAGSFSYQIKVTDGQGTPVTTIGSIVTVTIAKGNQTITFASTAPTGATVGGATYAVSATTNAPLVVAFSSATPAVCTISGNTVSMVGTGTCTINADQAGDTNWNPAAQVQQSFTVGAAGAVTTSLSFSTASLGVGSTGTLTITFGNPNSSATPNIAPLLSGSALLSRVSGAPGGTCGASGADSGANYQFNVFSVPSGNCTVTLTYTGTTPGSVSGLVLGAFTPSGYPTTGSASSGSIAVVPTVTGVSPPSGPVSQVVTVSGTGFSTTPGNNTVTFGAAGNGTVTAASATSLTVTTPAVGSGAANLTVTVNGQTSTNSVAYTFIDKPIAANKPGVVIPYGSTGTPIDLSASITGGPHSSIAIGTAASHGTTSIAGDVVTYTPTAGYFGTDSFTYTATGAGGTSNVATVSLTVATPTAPTVADKNAAIPYNSTGTAIDLAPSIGGVYSTVAVATGPQHGTVTIAGTVVTYTPTTNYYGADSFTYTATGPGGTSAPATVTLAVATPPAPVAANKSGVGVPYASTGTAIDLSTSVTGVHSSIAIGTAPAHGTVTIAGDVVTYTPNPATYYGADSFTFTATGPGGTSAPATVSLTVATPAAPVAANKSGVAVPYASTGTAIDLSASVTGVHSSIAIGTGPAHGTVTIAGDVVTYTPNPATYYGADSFTYTATGPGGTSAPATVSLTVATPPAPTVANKSGVAVPYASTGTAIDLSTSVTGVHSSIAIGTAPAHGTVTIAGDVVTYTPNPATYYGADSFTYTATGPGGTSAPATVSLTVATPAAPTAANKSGVAVAYNSSGTPIDLAPSVTGVHNMLTVVTAPAHGTTAVNGDVVTYTPTSGYFGADSFTYTVSGPGGTSAAATVSLTVATPPPPNAGPGTSTVAGSTTTAGTSVQINLSALVTGVYDSIQLASQPAHGTVTLSGGAGPSLTPVAAAPTSPYIATYTPAANFAGADSFTYVAVGPGGASAPGTVTITVVGQVPVAAPKTATAGDGQMVSVMLTDGAARGPFTGANVVSISPANSATTAIVATGNGTYRLDVTPNNRFGGQIVVAYTLSNVFGASAPSTVTLTVQARPDPRNDPDIAAISDAQAETTRRFARAQVSNFMRRAEQLHNGGGSAGLAMGVTLASRDGSAPMQRPDDKNWGLAITERMRVSGEDPAIGRVVNNPQSPLSRGDQLGSGRTIAGTGGAGTGGAGGADGAAGDDRAAPGKGAVDEDGNRRIGSLAIWAGGAIDIGTRDRRTDRSKITATTAGLSAGADIKLSEGVLVGLGGGYGNDLSRIGTAAQVRGTSTIYAAYASVQPASGTFIDGMIGRGQLDFTTRRIAQAVNATARGSRDGSYTIAAISLGIDRAEGPLQWSIYGRGEYMDADLDAYAESGAGRYNLRFDARQVRSITGTLGGRLQYRQKTGFGSITPRLRVEWNHEFANVDAQWLDYADIPGAAIYALAGNGWRREQLQLSFGTRFDILSSGWSFDFETGLRAAQGEKAGTLQLRLSKRW